VRLLFLCFLPSYPSGSIAVFRVRTIIGQIVRANILTAFLASMQHEQGAPFPLLPELTDADYVYDMGRVGASITSCRYAIELLEEGAKKWAHEAYEDKVRFLIPLFSTSSPSCVTSPHYGTSISGYDVPADLSSRRQGLPAQSVSPFLSLANSPTNNYTHLIFPSCRTPNQCHSRRNYRQR
jgi:hypothetical protein